VFGYPALEVNMGVENNNAVIATTWKEEEIERIKSFIDTLDDFHKQLFLVSGEVINGKITIVMVPDGSKEGWEGSEKADAVRTKFIEELKKGNYEDGSSPWDYVEVGYGEFGQKVLRGNCKNRYDDREYE